MLRPLNEFEKAIKSRPIRITGTHLGLDCGTIIAALNIKKNEAETAIALVDYWKIVPECEVNVRHQAVESLVSRALLMLSSSKAYSWVVSIATEAIQSPTKDTWVGRLTKDLLLWAIALHGIYEFLLLCVCSQSSLFFKKT